MTSSRTRRHPHGGDLPSAAARRDRGSGARSFGGEGDRCPSHRDSGCRGRQGSRGRGLLLGGARPDRPDPQRRDRQSRRRRRHRPRRFRGRDVDARRADRARPDDPARDGRRRRRRQDRDQHRGRQEPGRCIPRAVRGPDRPRDAGNGAAQRDRRRHGRGHQDRIHRRSGDPRSHRGRSRGRVGSDRNRAPGADPPLRRGQGEGGRRGPQGVEPAGDPHYGHTLGHAIERRERTAGVTAPQWPSAWCTPPNSVGWPAASTTPPPTGPFHLELVASHHVRRGRVRGSAEGHADRQEKPRRAAAFRSCSTGFAKPVGSRAPTRRCSSAPTVAIARDASPSGGSVLL